MNLRNSVFVDHPGLFQGKLFLNPGFALAPPGANIKPLLSQLKKNYFIDQRSDLKPSRISETSNSGCSHAAKCPPLSSLL